jgi:hypothetical protein
MMTNDSHAIRLARVRLRTLISTQSSDLEIEHQEVAEFGSAVGIVFKNIAWVLLTSRHEFGLGPAMIWALRNGATSLNIFTEHNGGDLARRAGFFNFEIDVYEIASDLAVSPVLALPCVAQMKEISATDESFADFIRSSGAEVTREHGVLAGEVCGLEVCRVVHDDTDTAVVESRLEIGVGTHDRETFQLLHGRTATIESLRKVVEEVASKRIAGANPHPLNQLGRERLLRHLTCLSPHLVDAISLQSVAPPMPRANLKDQVPCCAAGISRSGQSLVAIFSIGIDPDVISFGADARQAIDAQAELIFVSPQRDIVPAIAQLAELLFIPARFVGCNLLDAPTRGRD